MRAGKNICSLCNRNEVKFYHLKDSIRASNDLRFVGHTDLQAVLEKILNKNGKYREASNEICQKCRDKLHGIYSLTHRYTESEKYFHQFEFIAETDKDVDSLECSSSVADIEYDGSVVSKVVVKNECHYNFQDTDSSKLTKDLSVGFLEGEYSNAAGGRNLEQKKIDSIGSKDSEQTTFEDDIIKEEWTMQEGDIFEAKSKPDVLYREQTKFSCDICDEEFITVYCLTKHMKIVHESDLHDFDQTDAEHNTKMEGHTQRSHTKKDFACDRGGDKYVTQTCSWVHKMTNPEVTLKYNKCDQHFYSKHALGDHQLTHCVAALNVHKLNHSGISSNCDQCDAKYKSYEDLRNRHISHAGETFTCNKCNASFSNKMSLTRHLRRVHTDTMFSCDHCNATYKNKQALKLHKQRINGVYYNCDQCDATFKSFGGLRQHKESHTGVEFPCNKCDASFNNKKSLTQHLRGVHTDAAFSCDSCDASYKSKQSLNLHKQIHNGILFNCDQCDAKYKTKDGLRNHKFSHTGVTFACNQCDAIFFNKKGLRNHLRVVHTDAAFSCDSCDASYKSKQSLNVHKQIHNGILFNCDQCDAKYKTSGSLRHHKISHTGVTFTCNKCDASFSNKRSLTGHLRRVHTETVFSCDHCDATYKSKRALNEHKLLQHASREKFKQT